MIGAPATAILGLGDINNPRQVTPRPLTLAVPDIWRSSIYRRGTSVEPGPRPAPSDRSVFANLPDIGGGMFSTSQPRNPMESYTKLAAVLASRRDDLPIFWAIILGVALPHIRAASHTLPEESRQSEFRQKQQMLTRLRSSG